MPKGRWTAEPRVPKYRQILEKIARDIRGGKFQPGQRLPSEAALVQQFGTSRITIGRALRELKERGMVERVAGSGTFVPAWQPRGRWLAVRTADTGLGRNRIFEPICQGMAAPADYSARFAVGSNGSRDKRAAGSSSVPSVHRAQGVGGVFCAARTDSR